MNLETNRSQRSFNRLRSIDQYRGLAILLMVLADYLSHIRRVPAWLKHAPGVGLTVVDLIAPMFIFVIGLVYRRSLQRRVAGDGSWRAALHFIRRFLALMGIGTLTPWGYTWGLFQTIGGAGLISLLVIWLPARVRLIIGGVLLGGYQFLLDKVWLRQVTQGSSWCEMEGTLGWAGMMILATVLADWFYDRPRGWKFYLPGSVLFLGMGVGLSYWIEVSQYFVSASYVLISLGASALLFAGFHLITERWQVRLPLHTAWGKNPLVLYLAHYWIWVLVFIKPLNPGWYMGAPLWLIVLQASGFIGVLSLLAWYLHRRGWIVSL